MTSASGDSPGFQDAELQGMLDRLDSLASGDAKAAAVLSSLKAKLRRSQIQSEAQAEELSAFREAYEKLTQPAYRIGVLLKVLEEGRLASVALGDTEYIAALDPGIDSTSLKTGARVRLNEAYAVVGLAEDSGGGPLIKVAEVMADGRLRIGGEGASGQSRLVGRCESLIDQEIKAGDEVRLDASGRLALEVLSRKEASDYFIEEIPDTPWEKIGGQEEAIELIKETIEQPLLYPELYAKFDQKPVKGILLYGPPGCGKTLIGKAIACSLARDYSLRSGKVVKECFLHISGPKILNMWLGETERMVREIFAAAREKAKEGRLVVIFIDEAESILRTRSGGRWMNISNTLVPQFNAEMDGLVSLENVLVVLTSNRPDYIDPAILRPERIDRKIKIKRPGRAAAKDIFDLYLLPTLPIDRSFAQGSPDEASARECLIEGAVEFLWREDPESEFLRVYHRHGGAETLYWRDLVSGALIKSVVDRAKMFAIKRSIAEPEAGHGLSLSDLEAAISAEFKESEIFPRSDLVEDWLKLIDVEPETVASVKPVGGQTLRSFDDKGIS